MTATSEESPLSRLEQLVAGEMYRKALHEIDRLRKKRPKKADRLRLGVMESHCLTGIGELTKAMKAAQTVVETGRAHYQYRTTVIDGLLEVASAAWGLGKSNEILEACEQAERMRKELQDLEESSLESIRASILYHESVGWYLKDDVHRAIDCARESLSIREQLGDSEGVVSSLMRVGYFHLEVDRSKTLEYEDRALELNRQLGRKRHIIQSLMHRGLIAINERNWSKAEQLLQEGMSLTREHDLGYWLRPGLFFFGALYSAQGDFARSEDFHRECLALSERTGAGMYIALGSNHLGEIHRARGDLDKALKRYERHMKWNKEEGRVKGYLTSLANCGLVQYAMGCPDKALTLLDESLALAEEQEQKGLLGGHIRSYNILYIVAILVEKGMVKQAQKRLERLRRISEETRDNYDEQVYLIAAALVLKSSMLPRNRVIAKEHLTDVVDGSFFNYETSTLALLHLTELLVDDFRMSGDTLVLENLNIRLSKLLDMATKQGSTLLLIETRLLQSKMALLQLDADKASRLLNEAQSLAEQKGLDNISRRIIEEQNTLLNELTIWEKLGEEKPTMIERTEKVRLHEQIGAMIQQGVWRKMLF